MAYFIRNVLSWFSVNQCIYVDIVLTNVMSVELEIFLFLSNSQSGMHKANTVQTFCTSVPLE
jgi:hypothetical protein